MSGTWLKTCLINIYMYVFIWIFFSFCVSRNCCILYTWLYITDSNSFNFNGILETSDCTDESWKGQIVCNLRWRNIISKLEKSLNNMHMYIHCIHYEIQINCSIWCERVWLLWREWKYKIFTSAAVLN